MEDVKQRRIHVAGRQMHYVCGVSAKHELNGQSYKFVPLPRGSFAMYPEERFGMELQSSSIMWENVEDLFKEIRKCMSAARHGTASGTSAFWKVRLVTKTVLEVFYLLTCGCNSHFPLGNCRSCRQK